MHNSIHIAHISDIHYKFITVNPLLCKNKRAKGILRQVFCSTEFYADALTTRLPKLFKSMNVNKACITGDLSFTALDKEFTESKKLLDNIQENGISIELIPGNHDFYTSKSFDNKTFYKFFPNNLLETNRVFITQLTDSWSLLNLDCTHKNTWFTANGNVYKHQLENINELLSKIPNNHNIIIANHFPILQTQRGFHDLLNRDSLLDLLNSYNCVKLYIHGHDHHAELFYPCTKHNFTILNSGSISLKSNASFSSLIIKNHNLEILKHCISNLTEYKSDLIIHSKEIFRF